MRIREQIARISSIVQEKKLLAAVGFTLGPVLTAGLLYLLSNSGNFEKPMLPPLEKTGAAIVQDLDPQNIDMPEVKHSAEFSQVLVSTVEQLEKYLYEGQAVITILTDTEEYTQLATYLSQFPDGQIYSSIDLSPLTTPTAKLEPLTDQLSEQFAEGKIVTIFDTDCLQSQPLELQTEPVQEVIKNENLITVQVALIKFGAKGEEVPYNVYARFTPEKFEKMRELMGVHDATFAAPATGHGNYIMERLMKYSDLDSGWVFVCASALSQTNFTAIMQELAEQDAAVLLFNRSLLAYTELTKEISSEVEKIATAENPPVIAFINATGNNYKRIEYFGLESKYILGVAALAAFNNPSAPDQLEAYSNIPAPSDDVFKTVAAAGGTYFGSGPNGEIRLLIGTSMAGPEALAVIIRYIETSTAAEVESLKGMTTQQIYERALQAVYPGVDTVGEYKSIFGGNLNATFSISQADAQAISSTLRHSPSYGEILGARIVFSDTSISAHDHSFFGIDPLKIEPGPLAPLFTERSIKSLLLQTVVEAQAVLITKNGEFIVPLPTYNGLPQTLRSELAHALTARNLGDSLVTIQYIGGGIFVSEMLSRPSGLLPLRNGTYLPLIFN